jgi:hypothetical protein
LTAAIANAAVVYENSTSNHGRLNTGALEIGDQIILGGTDRNLTQFRFQFYTSAALGGATEQARVRFYNNPTESSAPTTVLFDSGWFDVGAPQSSGATFTFNDFVTGATVPLTTAVPNMFTWSVQFQGIDAGEEAGLSIFGPPTVGNAYPDYWENNGGTWTLKTLSGIPTGVDFGAQFTAVPEPSTVTLGLLGLVGLVGLTWRKRA